MASARRAMQAARLRQRRNDLNLTQRQLARLIGTTQRQVVRYESGENDPSLDALSALASALNVSADWILGLTDDLARSRPGPAGLEEREVALLRVFREVPAHLRRSFLAVSNDLRKSYKAMARLDPGRGYPGLVLRIDVPFDYERDELDDELDDLLSKV